MISAVQRTGAVVVAALLACVLGAAPAWAHTALESSSPAADSRVAEAPSEVSLTFSEDVPAGTAEIAVRGPDGAAYAAGPATGDDGTLRVPLRPLGPAGAYTVEYRVVSDDGHPVTGTVAFTLTAPGPGAAAASAPAASAPPAAQAAPAPAASATEEPGAPVWPWIVGAVVVLGAGAGFALRRTRS